MRIFLGLAAAFLLSVHAHAGEITRKSAEEGYSWASTECLRPLPPRIRPGQSSSDAIAAYALEIEKYIYCMQQEAQCDFEKAQMEIQAAIERDLERETKVMNDMMLNFAKVAR